jgi:hypothetical protein
MARLIESMLSPPLDLPAQLPIELSVSQGEDSCRCVTYGFHGMSECFARCSRTGGGASVRAGLWKQRVPASISQVGRSEGRGEVGLTQRQIVRLIEGLGIASLWFLLIAGQQNEPDVNQIVRQSARVAEQDLNARRGYEYSETDLQTDGSQKTYAVHMLSGSYYKELIAINGKPLPPSEVEQERLKLDQESSRRLHESPAERAKRLGEFEREQKRDQHFVQEFNDAFDFKLIGERSLNHRRVYVIQATPSPRFHPTNKESEVLTGMRGTLWIDAATDQWVRAEAKVIHPVSIEGFLAKVEPGTQFTLEKTPVANGVWLPKHYSMRAEAKILSLIPHSHREDETYFNYHAVGPAQSPTGGQAGAAKQ